MTILLVSAIIGAVIASIWYSKEKQKIREQYIKDMEYYLTQIEQSQQPRQQHTVEEHYTFFFKVPERHINNDADYYTDDYNNGDFD